MFVTHVSVNPCPLISAGKEGQETLGPEAQADEAGCAGTLALSPVLQVFEGVLCDTGLYMYESCT